MSRRKLLVVLLAGFTLVASVSAATIADPPVALRGTFVTHFTGVERFSWHGHRLPTGMPNAGTWKLVITRSNATFYNPAHNATFPVGSSFSFTAGRFTFGFDPNCPQNYGSRDGVYTYQLNGRALTLHVVQDSCLDRIATLVLHTWRKQ